MYRMIRRFYDTIHTLYRMFMNTYDCNLARKPRENGLQSYKYIMINATCTNYLTTSL